MSSDLCGFCGNFATCEVIDVLTYDCLCNYGINMYTGFCLRPNNPCAKNPCFNFGSCSYNSSNNTLFDCNCIDGFYGALCEFEVDICEDKCFNGAQCKTFFIMNDSSDLQYEKVLRRDFECFCTDFFYGERCEYANDSYKVLKVVSRTIGIASFVSIGFLYIYILIMDLTKIFCKIGV